MSMVLDRAAGAATPELDLSHAIDRACRRIAPLWPLKNFVAVNPFLGFAGQSFHATCATLNRVARLDMVMPRAYYRAALRDGRIEDRDLQVALDTAPVTWRVPDSLPALRDAAARDPVAQPNHPGHVATIAEVLDGLAGGDRFASRTLFMTDEISRWCAAYFDQGQAVWRLPDRTLRPYPAWLAAMHNDLNAEAMGIRDFRTIVDGMPKDPVEAIGEVLLRIGVPPRATEDYLHQALLDIAGWAAYARYVMWEAELGGSTDDTIYQLLAIRVVWGYALFAQRRDAAFTTAWRRAMAAAAVAPADDRLGDDAELCLTMILHEALEHAYRRRLFARLAAGPSVVAVERPAVQAAFCIDVRSEVYRRALEAAMTDARTVGFAGFFGIPIEYVPIGHVSGRAHCPVLLRPVFTVCEAVTGTTDADRDRILAVRLLRRRVAKAWKSFKLSAISSFVYVEAAGLLFAAKILGDTLALTRTVNDPNTDGLDAAAIGRLGPRIEPRVVDGKPTGFDLAQRVTMAEAVLRAMSMTGDFARLVLLAGHGSTTVNNPHASGLDCGACGGNTGEANARVAAAILNDPAVRAGLRERGIAIPADTWFLGGLHDTTTDDVRLWGEDDASTSHRIDIAALREALARATALCRQERAPALGIALGPAGSARILARSRDWAQVRPEWGLAGNAAFIAAPRARTRGIDLAGRVFLHDYDWRQDTGFAILELIMTAPMVVASWINLQYYGSSVNNSRLGAGNKVLHNVTGMIGVLEGNAGDLKIGLPLQSVHDGTRFVHEPVRLTVIIEAPADAVEAVIVKHEGVRDLVANDWLHLFVAPDGPAASLRQIRG